MMGRKLKLRVTKVTQVQASSLSKSPVTGSCACHCYSPGTVHLTALSLGGGGGQQRGLGNVRQWKERRFSLIHIGVR